MRTPMSDKKQFAVVMLISALFDIWILYSSLGILLINQRLESDPELASYPYPPRVLKPEGASAVPNTCRSPEPPARVGARARRRAWASGPADSRGVLKAEHLRAKMPARAEP